MSAASSLRCRGQALAGRATRTEHVAEAFRQAEGPLGLEAQRNLARCRRYPETLGAATSSPASAAAAAAIARAAGPRRHRTSRGGGRGGRRRRRGARRRLGRWVLVGGVFSVVSVPTTEAIPLAIRSKLPRLVLATLRARHLTRDAFSHLQAFADALCVVAFVVVLPLGVGAQNLECLAKQLERCPRLVGVGVGCPLQLLVRVLLSRPSTVRRSDLCVARVLGHAKDAVVVRTPHPSPLELGPLDLPKYSLVLLPSI
mmetsp:Transcript_88627/g.284515  ORF Transcript_88627/g.284515 Transcript_88627/m.284515 type:complete len:257 (-) Transcript_88627:1129-1899(-)